MAMDWIEKENIPSHSQENVDLIAELFSKANNQENVQFEADLNSTHILALTASEQEEWDRKTENKSVANDIGKRVSLLCMVMTFPDNHFTKAIHVKETWGKRCDKLVFMSTEEEPHLPTVKIPVESTKDNLWKMHQLAFQYIFDHHLQEAEWFMKADDDTYVIVENVKYLLNDYNTNDAVYFGCRTIDGRQSYFDGGAGYVLSREAVSMLITKGSQSEFCTATTPAEKDDLLLAICLNKLGAIPMDTRDNYQRHRFFMSTPEGHMVYTKYKDAWYHLRKQYYPNLTGRHCCSEYAISFHQIDNNKMYILEYFLYHLRLYGVSYEYQQIYN